MKTKREVRAWCKQNGLELEHDRGSRQYRQSHPLYHHVHVYTPSGKIFGEHDLHNLSLWDGDAPPNWKLIGKDLLEAGLTKCDKPDCEWCCEDDE